MRKLIYVGDRSCRPCRHYKETVIEPLMKKYPESIEVHVGLDANARKMITSVPTLVIEEDGVEQFRFSAFLESEKLEAIIAGGDLS